MFNFYSLQSARSWVMMLVACISITSLCAQTVSQLTNVSTNPAPGVENVQGNTIKPVNGKMYFAANPTYVPGSGVYYQPFVSDGTPEGTQRLANVEVSSSSIDFAQYNGKVYFFCSGSGYALCASDGTPGNSEIVKGFSTSNTSKLHVANGKLFFLAPSTSNPSSQVIWISDGTSAGTKPLSDVVGVPIGNPNPAELTAVGNKLFYRANTGEGDGVYVTDGTTDGTRLVRGGAVSSGSPIPYFSNQPRSFSKLSNEKLIFRAAAEGTEDEPWITDGTSEGTFSPDIVGSGYGSFPDIVPGSETYNGRFYFTTGSGSSAQYQYQQGLYATDGTVGGTHLVKPDVRQAKNFTRFNNKLYFTVLDGSLWLTDGTESGTHVVNGSPSGARNLTVADEKLYFTVAGSSLGDVLWSTDGTTIRRVNERDEILGRRVKSLVAFNDQLYLTDVPISSSTKPELFRLNANRPPVAPTIADASGRAGEWFYQVIPSFSDPDGDILAYSVTGLPSGLSFSGGSGGIVGGLTTEIGEFRVTVTATDPGGLSASVTYKLFFSGVIVVNNPPIAPAIPDQTITVNQPFVFTIPNFTDPENQNLTYQVSGYPAGFSYFSSSTGAGQISGQTPLAGSYMITVKATDTGGLSTSTAFLLIVNATGTTPPGSTLQLLPPTYNCTTGFIVFNVSGGDGSYVTYTAPGISRGSVSDNIGVVEYELRQDPKPILLQAHQNGVTVSYTFDLPSACGGGGTSPSQPLQLLPPTYDCITGVIKFNVSGGDGAYVTYTAPGISRGSVSDNIGVVEYELRQDPKPILLQAHQNGVTVSYTFDLPSACNGQARKAVLDEPGTGLQVKALGNPVFGETVEIEIYGAEGQSLIIGVNDLQGRPINYLRIEQASAVETRNIRLGQSAGTYLLRVATPSQARTIRVLRK